MKNNFPSPGEITSRFLYFTLLGIKKSSEDSRKMAGVLSTRNLSPYLEDNCTGSVWYSYFRVLESIEDLKLPGKGLDNTLRSIPGLKTETATQPHGRQCVPWTTYRQLVGVTVHKKDPVLQIFKDLFSDHWFLAQIIKLQMKMQLLLKLHPLFEDHPSELTSKRFKGSPSFFPFISCPPFLEPDIKD